MKDLREVPLTHLHNTMPNNHLEVYSPETTQVFYENSKTSILCGDVTNEQLFEEEFIDLIVTSPPYNVGIGYASNNDELSYEDYVYFSRTWLANCYSWSKPQARMLLNIPLDKNKGGQKSVGADITKIAQDLGWKYHSTIIWNEGNISRRTAWGSWLSASAPYVIAPVELILVLYKESWKKTGGSKESDISKQEFMDWTNGLWTFPGESKKRIGHPAPFPKELPYRAIKLFSFVDDMVFDPFMGSGTSLVVAQNLQRRSVGVDIDRDYCQLAQERLLKESGMLFL